ncbi:MAG: rhamnulokinase [Lachnospiraceae bacterium]
MKKETRNFLAMDYGGSTGRGILGRFDGRILKLEEMHRFQNYYVNQNGTFFWDVYRLFHEMLYSIKSTRKKYGSNGMHGIGIDTWGTDYGLLDRNGQLLGNVRCMRNANTQAVEEVTQKVGATQLFSSTGLQTIPGNTVFQLYERLKKKDPALLHADKMLMLPDLLGYFLTGIKREEYTMATTSMCFNPTTRNWDYELLSKLELPTHIFADISYPGAYKDSLLPAVLEEVGMNNVQHLTVGTHDTAAAVAATPLEEDELFCSSGTWSLFGIETKEAVLGQRVQEENFSNEGTVDGKFRLLKNIMGMWLIQECMRQWKDAGLHLTWDEVVKKAEIATPFESFLDTEEPELYNAGNMIEKIQSYCRRTNQKVPVSVGELARCIYQSIAMRYRKTTEQLTYITQKRFKALHIVGGGSQNELLNQFAANVLGIPVYSGLVEAASIGNVLVQSMAMGEVHNLTEIRDIVKNSFEIKSFLPQESLLWEEGYAKYCAVLRKGEAK